VRRHLGDTDQGKDTHFGLESIETSPEIVRWEIIRRADSSGEKTRTLRAVRKHWDTELCSRFNRCISVSYRSFNALKYAAHTFSGLTLIAERGDFDLNMGDGMDGVGPPQRRCVALAYPNVVEFSFADEGFENSDGFFDRPGGIDAGHLKYVNALCATKLGVDAVYGFSDVFLTGMNGLSLADCE
jgi:hypothetical protein